MIRIHSVFGKQRFFLKPLLRRQLRSAVNGHFSLADGSSRAGANKQKCLAECDTGAKRGFFLRWFFDDEALFLPLTVIVAGEDCNGPRGVSAGLWNTDGNRISFNGHIESEIHALDGIRNGQDLAMQPAFAFFLEHVHGARFLKIINPDSGRGH